MPLNLWQLFIIFDLWRVAQLSRFHSLSSCRILRKEFGNNKIHVSAAFPKRRFWLLSGQALFETKTQQCISALLNVADGMATK